MPDPLDPDTRRAIDTHQATRWAVICLSMLVTGFGLGWSIASVQASKRDIDRLEQMSRQRQAELEAQSRMLKALQPKAHEASD